MGKRTSAQIPQYPHLIHSWRVVLSGLLAPVVQGKWWREGAMIRRAFFLHYRMVREAVTVIVTIGTALLLSYLILWMKL
jgi:hypothetical protein